MEEEALSILDKLISEVASENMEFIRNFLNERFKKLKDRENVAILYGKMFEKTGDKKYLELKHYSLFISAQEGEGSSDFDRAKFYYELIIADNNRSRFTEPSFFNLAVIEDKQGNKLKAIRLLQNVIEGNLERSAKELIYNIGLETNNFLIAAEAAEKLGIQNNDPVMLIKSGRLYLQTGMYGKAEKVIEEIEKRKVEHDLRREFNIMKGLYFYYIKQYQLSIPIFFELLKDKKYESYDNEVINVLNELLKKAVFILPDDEARDFIENVIELCNVRYKDKYKCKGDC